MRAVLIGAVLLLGACGVAQAERVKLSGQDERRPVQVGAFDKVELKGPDRVDVRVGAAQSVSMSGDRAVLERMIVRVEDGKLIVERRDRNTRTNGDRERAVVSVTMPRMRAAATGGSGAMAVDRVNGDLFSAAVGGSGQLAVGPKLLGHV